MDHVAIVILNHNGRFFLEQFLPTVLAYSDHHPVYVADNASTDDSVVWVRQQFPHVRLIQLAINLGYAGGYNAALTQIAQGEHPPMYYILLNSDVEVTPGWTAPLLQLLESHPQAAGCQPKIRSYAKRAYFEYAGAAGGFLDYLGYAYCQGRLFDTLEQDVGQYDRDYEIFWATGACLVIRAEVFHQLGGFDERFFAHMEEIDLCWRAKNAGYQLWYCSDSVVYHVGGGTLHKSNPYKTFLNYRNSLAMLYKNLSSETLIRTLLLRMVLDGLSAVRLLLSGQWRDSIMILKAHATFYYWLPYLRRQRKALLPLWTHSAAYSDLYPRSIIWQYFVKKCKTASDL